MQDQSNSAYLNDTVFPSDEKTVKVWDTSDIYGGAHTYKIKECIGFNNGKTEYTESFQKIQFIQKQDNGEVIPGIQSEQLIIMLIDRQRKLNARFPSVFNEKAIKGLEMFLEAQKERVEDRLNRGVMGDLKK